jgi:hypothetical protein
LRGGLLERRRPLDRHASDTGILKPEPAQDARLASRLLGVLEPRVAEPGGVEEEAELRPRGPVAGDREGQRRQ